MEFFDTEPLAGFDVEIGLLLAGLHDSSREWRGELGKPPVEAIVWQPRPRGHSIGGILLHMADCEAYWFETFSAHKQRPEGEESLLLSKETNVDDGDWPSPPAEPIEWYFDLLDRIRSRSFEALRDLKSTSQHERPGFSATLRWVVAHVLEHDSYHGGQAVLLHDLWNSKK